MISFYEQRAKKKKKKKRLIRNIMGIENVEIRVIKWESWNDKREREREREMIFTTTASRIIKKNKIIAIAKSNRAKLSISPMRTHDYNNSLSTRKII